MTASTNMALVRRRFEELDRGNLRILEELFDTSYVLHFPGQVEPLSLEDTKRLYQQLYAAFPDLRHEIDDQIAARDKVVTRWTASGTHQGPFLGVRPTRKKVSFTGINIYRIVNEKLVESHVSWDMLGLLQQLRAIRRKAVLAEL